LYSSADEKLIRIFDAPLSVIDGLEVLCNINKNEKKNENENENEKNLINENNSNFNNDVIDSENLSISRVRRAYIPELGLSNRAAEMMSSQEKTEQDARNVQGLERICVFLRETIHGIDFVTHCLVVNVFRCFLDYEDVTYLTKHHHYYHHKVWIGLTPL
jgi:hypothetical protein